MFYLLYNIIEKTSAMAREKHPHLVGGLEHEFYVSKSWDDDDDPIWRTHIIQRGRYTTNQITINHH